MDLIYLTTSPLIDYVKIGAWKNAVKILRSRYATYYGTDTVVTVFRCDDRFATEGHLKQALQFYHIGGELYSRDAIPLFLRFGELHCHDHVELAARTDVVVRARRAVRVKLTAELIEDQERSRVERKRERDGERASKRLRAACSMDDVRVFLSHHVVRTANASDRVSQKDVYEHYNRVMTTKAHKHGFCQVLRELLGEYHMLNINRPGTSRLGYKMHCLKM